jgi:RNA polymerase sigma-70 factor (ECF subfamily)
MTAIGMTAGRPEQISDTDETSAAGRPMSSALRAASFDAFYSGTAMRVVRYAYALTGNPADAQDIAHEAFARAWQRWASVSACHSPEAWVRRVATNLATSRWRRDRIAREAAHKLAGQRYVPEISTDTVALVAALRQLPERQRVVIVLHHLADLTIDEIAAELHCPAGSIKVWLSRGRAALAAALSESETIID